MENRDGILGESSLQRAEPKPPKQLQAPRFDPEGTPAIISVVSSETVFLEPTADRFGPVFWRTHTYAPNFSCVGLFSLTVHLTKPEYISQSLSTSHKA